jgi:serine/threonine-protein kinase
MRTERVVIKASRHPDRLPIIEREHAILQRVRHPNVARGLGWAIRPGGPALVLAWAGRPLDEILGATRRHGRPLGVGFAVSVARQLCDALTAVHAAEIIHLEVRPDHVLVAADGTVTLIDFGFVLAAEPRMWDSEYGFLEGQISPGPLNAARYRYMSPEQARGRKVGAYSDLFSAALVMCELVDGRHSAPGADVFNVLIRIRDGNLVIPPAPPRITEAIRRALAPRAADRHQSARELGEELAYAAASSSLDTGPHVIAQTLCELGIPA